jgi:hypothetical protein
MFVSSASKSIGPGESQLMSDRLKPGRPNASGLTMVLTLVLHVHALKEDSGIASLKLVIMSSPLLARLVSSGCRLLLLKVFIESFGPGATVLFRAARSGGYWQL